MIDPWWNMMMVGGLVLGNALNFGTNTGFVNFGDQSRLDGHARMSWSFWINQDTLSTQRMVTKWGLGVGKRSYVIESAGTDEVDFLVSGDGTTLWNVRTTSSPLAGSGTWKHILIAFDGVAGTVVIYVGGIPQSYSVLSGSAPASIFSGPGKFYTGQNDGHTGFTLDGKMDELGVWSRTLVASDAIDLATGLYIDRTQNFPTSGISQGLDLELLIHYDQSSGNVAPDSSVNGYNGAVTGMVDSDWVPGKVLIP